MTEDSWKQVLGTLVSGSDLSFDPQITIDSDLLDFNALTALFATFIAPSDNVLGAEVDTPNSLNIYPKTFACSDGLIIALSSALDPAILNTDSN